MDIFMVGEGGGAVHICTCAGGLMEAKASVKFQKRVIQSFFFSHCQHSGRHWLPMSFILFLKNILFKYIFWIDLGYR